MSEPSDPSAPPGQKVVPTADGMGRMTTIYVMSCAFIVALVFFIELLDASKRSLNITPTYVAAVATVAVLVPVILAIPAGLITAIVAIWIKKNRRRLFMRIHFYLTVLVVSMSVMTTLFMLYL